MTPGNIYKVSLQSVLLYVLEMMWAMIGRRMEALVWIHQGVEHIITEKRDKSDRVIGMW